MLEAKLGQLTNDRLLASARGRSVLVPHGL